MTSPFLESIRSACRLRGYSLQTEKTYIYWTRQYIYFHNKRHPSECGPDEVTRFLSYLAEEKHVAVNTQKVALNALVFVYRHVLKIDLGDLGFSAARKQRQLPIVLSQTEVCRLIDSLQGRDKLIFQLLYGSGLRVSECLRLRVKDIDTENYSVTVFDGKGKKDRQTILGKSLIEPIENSIEAAIELQAADTKHGIGTAMPPSLIKKYPNAQFTPAWAYLFPASKWCEHPLTNINSYIHK